MNNFFKDLNKTDKLTINDLAIFHCRFEYIHPFLDGNGRLGRFILLKQCLQNDIDLFVIVNDTRNEYINSLRMYCQTNSHKFLLSYLSCLQKTFNIFYSRFLNRDFNDNESKVIAYISTHGLITRRQVESMLHLSLSGATKILKKLVDKNIIEKHNGSRNIVYRLIFD
jgi:Fic family protein